MDLLVYYWGRTPILFLRRGTGFRPRELVAPRADLEHERCGARRRRRRRPPDLIIGNYFADGDRVLDARVRRSRSRCSPRCRARPTAAGDRVLLWVGPRALPRGQAARSRGDAARRLDARAGRAGPQRRPAPGDLHRQRLRQRPLARQPLATRPRPASARDQGASGRSRRRDRRSSAATRSREWASTSATSTATGSPTSSSATSPTPFALHGEQLRVDQHRRAGDRRARSLRGPQRGARPRAQRLGLGHAPRRLRQRRHARGAQATGFVARHDRPLARAAGACNRQRRHARGPGPLAALPRRHGHQRPRAQCLLRPRPRRPLLRRSPRRPASGREQVTRGIATGDVNADGRLDLVVANQWERSYLYLNRCLRCGRSLGLRSAARGQARGPAIGAAATVRRSDGLTLTRQVDGGNGHSGKRSRELHFGLGDRDDAVALTVRWRDASGRVASLRRRLAPGRHTIVLGGTR